MTSKTLTWILGAIAASLAVALVAVLLYRPQPQPSTAEGPVNPAPTAPRAPTAAMPSTSSVSGQETDAAAEGGPSPLPSSEVQDHGDASPGATPYSQTDAARWRPVATGFGRAFTATKAKSDSEWRASLAPYVTGNVREQLTTVDPRNVPAGEFASIEPAEYGEDKVAVYIHYDTGLTLVTYLILDGTNWRIYAYDRWHD